MTARTATIASSAAAAAVVVVLLSAGDSGTRRAAAPVGRAAPAPARASSAAKHPRGVRVGCARRSEARFPGAFSAPANLVVGPLVLIGGGDTPASVVREFGGNKLPLLVKAGHTVTVRLAHRARRVAGLAYGGLGRQGPLRQGREVKVRDGADAMTFVACAPGRPTKDYRPEGPSGSDADGEPVTFWSGFVLSDVPACLPIEVYVDGDPSPRRVGLPLGRRC